MKLSSILLFLILFLISFSRAWAITPAELESRFKQLPSVAEKDLPKLSNQRASFRGALLHDGLEGHTWVTFPFIENPGSLCFDAKGVMYVAEANRFWLGVPDLRGANELIRDDFRAVTVADRLAMYQKYASSFPEGWFSRVADRVIRLEDRDGNGAPDHRTLFSDRFYRPEDGIGFSLLADGDAIYFTCIPSVWRLRDKDGDGRADEETEISTGYGVRVSFIGHDLHGITRGPDGRLYFSVGDRGFHVTTADGVIHAGSGRGAVFRCELDGSGLEVFAVGLRNPQELAFDDEGNLFTFDNTGDIGDKARFVYVLEGSDSGWDMSHQSAHHYATHLDWGEFRPEQSMWVKERMFDLYNQDEPQWVYPPASHVGEGPSGVVRTTGESLPEDLRDRFLLANYRGASDNCTILSVAVDRKGAGFQAKEVKELVKGVGASDIELGYDGNLYLCDFGGGWSVNENGSIQVLVPKDEKQRDAGKKVAELFRAGFEQRGIDELRALLSHPDRRVRQAAQFALVDRGAEGRTVLREIVAKSGSTIPRLHALWGLGQAGRLGEDDGSDVLLSLLRDGDEVIRGNAVRTLGDLRTQAALTPLREVLRNDASPAVRALAAVALGRIAKPGDTATIDALFAATIANGGDGTGGPSDVVLRHAILSGLSLIASENDASARVDSTSREERLMAVLVLRRKESPQLERFLNEKDPLILREVIRAVYDTGAMDSSAGRALAGLQTGIGSLPEAVQRRIVAANYRVGTAESALTMLKLATDSSLAHPVRKAALNGLRKWSDVIDTDPVRGCYRPQVVREGRDFAVLVPVLGPALRQFLADSEDSDLTALATELATEAKIPLDPSILLAQAKNPKLAAALRIAAVEGLLSSNAPGVGDCVSFLLDDANPLVRADAVKAAFALGQEGIAGKAEAMITKEPLPVARAAIAGLTNVHPEKVVALWGDRETSLRKGLWLDTYQALSAKKRPEVAGFAASAKAAVHRLGLSGGDPVAGEVVFKNQGACLQCHTVGGQGGEKGGVQGPSLRDVGKRLSQEKILESVIDPGAEIAAGYGMTTVSLKNGDSVVGRISAEKADEITVTAPDGSHRTISRSEITSIAPPVSAMPPIGETLSPGDFRDLIAFLATQKGGKWNPEKAAQEVGEEIAK